VKNWLANLHTKLDYQLSFKLIDVCLLSKSCGPILDMPQSSAVPNVSFYVSLSSGSKTNSQR
jgi:hypothetical protein